MPRKTNPSPTTLPSSSRELPGAPGSPEILSAKSRQRLAESRPQELVEGAEAQAAELEREKPVVVRAAEPDRHLAADGQERGHGAVSSARRCGPGSSGRRPGSTPPTRSASPANE